MNEQGLKKDHFGYYNFKVILIGDGEVGKTSLIKRYVFNEFLTDYKATIGSNLYVKDIKYKDKDVKLTIWDIAGQQKWEIMRPVYYRGAHGVLAVYDVTNEESYKNLLTRWLDELKILKKTFKTIVIGNKIDLGDKIFAKDEELKEKFNFLAHIKASAKEGDNVEEAFRVLVEKLVEK
ncbi:MAG: GTP-binding protein [Candidatus Lokiarchaeota archaeon]|nr:GTP-binding protein [Candidatus Lokiarchaeota archaeon]